MLGGAALTGAGVGLSRIVLRDLAQKLYFARDRAAHLKKRRIPSDVSVYLPMPEKSAAPLQAAEPDNVAQAVARWAAEQGKGSLNWLFNKADDAFRATAGGGKYGLRDAISAAKGESNSPRDITSWSALPTLAAMGAAGGAGYIAPQMLFDDSWRAGTLRDRELAHARKKYQRALVEDSKTAACLKDGVDGCVALMEAAADVLEKDAALPGAVIAAINLLGASTLLSGGIGAYRGYKDQVAQNEDDVEDVWRSMQSVEPPRIKAVLVPADKLKNRRRPPVELAQLGYARKAAAAPGPSSYETAYGGGSNAPAPAPAAAPVADGPPALGGVAGWLVGQDKLKAIGDYYTGQARSEMQGMLTDENISKMVGQHAGAIGKGVAENFDKVAPVVQPKLEEWIGKNPQILNKAYEAFSNKMRTDNPVLGKVMDLTQWLSGFMGSGAASNTGGADPAGAAKATGGAGTTAVTASAAVPAGGAAT